MANRIDADNAVRCGDVDVVSSDTKQPILLVSLPRSGSTWVAGVLSRAAGTRYISEPADAYRWPEAFWAKLGLADYPTPYNALASKRFKRLWSTVLCDPSSFDENRFGARLLLWLPPSLVRFAVKPRRENTIRVQSEISKLAPPPNGDRLLIKDVTIPLCGGLVADWLGAKVLVLRRDPKKVVASWQKMNFPPEPVHQQPWVEENIERLGISVPSISSHAERLAWTVGLLDLALMKEAEARQWPVFTHERLINNTQEEFLRIIQVLGLKATDEMWQFLDDSKKSKGMGYSTSRTAEQLNESSSGVFNSTDEARIAKVLNDIGEHLPGQVSDV